MMVTDDSMSDDVFEAETDPSTTLQPQNPPLAPSPTGYKDYRPPEDVLRHVTNNTSAGVNYFSANQININQSNQEQEIIHKTILLGDSGVGKTSLLVQFNTKQFQTGNFSATVGIGFTNKIVSVDGKEVKLQIWDTAGQERFRSVTHAYYRDAHALLLLYDITNKLSFDNIRAWLVEIKEYAQDDVVIMLLGNKCDCDRDRVISREQGQRLAREHNVGFMETSAKTGLNVDLAFTTIARELTSRVNEEDPIVDDNRFSVQDYIQDHATRAMTCPPCQT